MTIYLIGGIIHKTRYFVINFNFYLANYQIVVMS